MNRNNFEKKENQRRREAEGGQMSILGIQKLHELDGVKYEQAYLAEITKFKDASNGVSHNDIAGALIIFDAGRKDLLDKLHARLIHITSDVDEDTVFSDLEFSAVNEIAH
jgi:hypothetical protein